jgi:hypothetical protein
MTNTNNKDRLEADDVVREMGYGEMSPELREQWRARETDMRVQARIQAIENAKLQAEGGAAKERADLFHSDNAAYSKLVSRKYGFDPGV